MFNLKGKTALITGASAGFGAHFASVLTEAGADLILAARRLPALEEIATAIRQKGVQATTLELDVSDSRSIAQALAAFTNIDILINNAGITRNGSALDQTEASWDEVVATNLKGMFLVSQTVAKSMRDAKKGGSIINIASVLGQRQAAGVLPYAVSKAGVLQLTKVMALELARFGIRVNALAPGYFDTDINHDFWQTEAGKALIRRIPQRRLGALADLDGPLLLLASDASRFMTGSVIAVDGGHLVGTI